VFSAHSDLVLRLAWALGGISMAVAVGLALQVLLMRLSAQRRERERAALAARWQPLLARAALGEALPDPLPAVRPRDRADLMLLWLRLQDGLRGSAHDGLNRLAQRLGLPEDAERWARPGAGSMAQRVLGLVALGHLGRAQDGPLLREALVDPLPLVSLGAARALLQIDAQQAAPVVLDEFLHRSDWPAARLGTLLREAGAQAVAEPLASRLLGGDAAQQQRLLPLLRFAETPHDGSVLTRLVELSNDPQVLSIALRQLHGPQALPRARELAGHPDALVRSAAAQALGRIGDAGDRERLLALMSDRDWWVRYRAAQAQLALPGTSAETVVALRRRLADRFARDALDHVCAEQAMHVGGALPLPAAGAAA
jgi:hypothetical protein